MNPLETIKAMPMRSRLGIGGGALAVVLVLFLLMKMAGAPSYTPLATGLKPADTGKITAALDQQGIAYELQANGTTVAVDKGAVAQARVALATAGVSTSSSDNPGFSLFDQQKLGASDFQQQVTYQRALEGEIANTIDSVSGVEGAQVQLVMPQDDLFSDTSSPATAAVLLQNSSDTMDPGAVRGIAQLVANSVKGLKTDNVTITDGTGQLLWPQGDGGAVAGATTKQAAEARYDSQLESTINAMLTRTLGPGQAQVQVNADLNMDKVTKNSLTYAKKGVPLKTTKDIEKLNGNGTSAAGTAGTAGNIPTYAAGGSGGGKSKYSHTVGTTDWGVDKTVANVEQAQGGVNKLSIALMTAPSVKNVAAVKAAVSAAAGVTPARGDTITQATVAFPKTATAATPKSLVPTALVGPLKMGLLGLGVLLFAFFTWRFLRRRESEALAQPEWLREFDEPVRLSELEAGGGATRELLPARQRDKDMDRLDQLVEREPDRVAAQVRQWMGED